MLTACTIIARNYAAHAHCLADSWFAVHGTPLVVLVLDDEGGSLRDTPRMRFVRPADVFAPGAYAALAGRYAPLELATAVKPTLLLHLLDGPVVYLDPDILVFASLESVGDLAERHGIVLTPHNLEPMPRDGLRPSEQDILLAGTFNLGFIAVGAQARPFLAWWQARLAEDCKAQPRDGYWVDQRWIDLVPSYFDHHVLRDPGCNVAYWNAWERDLEQHDGAWRAGNGPLRFFHFSGFDPTRPRQLSKHHLPHPRADPRRDASLATLARLYARRLMDAGYLEASRLAFTTPRQTTPALAPVVVAGYLSSDHGVGEAGRRTLEATRASGARVATWTSDQTVHAKTSSVALTAPSGDEQAVVAVVNADQFPVFVQDYGPGRLRDRYVVGVWMWETPTMPAAWADRFDLVDEVWAPSEYAAGAFRKATTKPVHVFPLPIAAPRPGPSSRAELGLPDGPLFVFLFDHFSVFERKNPLATIAAFREAFPRVGEATLVVKSTNGHRFPAHRARLVEAAGGRADILLLDGAWPTAKKDALLATCDAYISLHRAEGFGFTMAEAMALGRPVIATGWSGNMEFMDDDTAFLVRHRLVPVGPGSEPYLPDDLWADPDVHHAAALLRTIVDDPDKACALGAAAQRWVLDHHGVEARAAFVRDRLAFVALYQQRRYGLAHGRTDAQATTHGAALPSTRAAAVEPQGSPGLAVLPGDARAAVLSLMRRPRLWNSLVRGLGAVHRLGNRLRRARPPQS